MFTKQILSVVLAVGKCTESSLRPAGLAAQRADTLRPRLELRGGWAWHGGGNCHGARASGIALGAAFQTRGQIVAGLGADVFLAKTSCLDILLVRNYGGQEVEIRGKPALGPRIALNVGYAVPVAGVRTELTAGVGLVATYIDYGTNRGGEWSARRWYGGSGAVRLPAGFGLEVEFGRHQLAERYYARGADVVVAELQRWENMWRIAVAIPLKR